jgi:hypothetical protein
MARKRGGGARSSAGAKAGKRGIKKRGMKLKDLEAKAGRKVRGGYLPINISDVHVTTVKTSDGK